MRNTQITCVDRTYFCLGHPSGLLCYGFLTKTLLPFPISLCERPAVSS